MAQSLLNQIIFTIAITVQFITFATPGKIVDLMNIHDPQWESHLEQSLVMLESNCHENDIPFNREKVNHLLQRHEHEVKEDLTGCLHPIITQPLQYNINFEKPFSQEDVIRHAYIEPVCHKISSSISCLKPHKRALESCIREDGKAVSEFMKFACKNNGSILVEFVEEGGVECIIEHKDLFTKCLDGLGDKTDLANNSVQVCQYFREARDCGLSALSQCRRQRPATIVRSIFESINKELVGNCLTFDEIIITETNGSDSLMIKFYSLIFLCLIGLKLFS